jgi:hypothetical protein
MRVLFSSPLPLSLSRLGAPGPPLLLTLRAAACAVRGATEAAAAPHPHSAGRDVLFVSTEGTESPLFNPQTPTYRLPPPPPPHAPPACRGPPLPLSSTLFWTASPSVRIWLLCVFGLSNYIHIGGSPRVRRPLLQPPPASRAPGPKSWERWWEGAFLLGRLLSAPAVPRHDTHIHTQKTTPF